MAASFLKGVETIFLDSGVRPIQTVRTAIIGIIGTAPIHDVLPGDRTTNEPILILNDRDAAKYFGTRKSPGYTIPYALDAWIDAGSGACVVINVFNPTTDLNTVAAQVGTFNADNKIDLAHINTTVLGVKGSAIKSDIAFVFDGSNVIDLGTTKTEDKTFTGTPGTINLGSASATVYSVKNAAGTTTYALTTDYTIASGVITRVAGGTIPALATVKVEYSLTEITKVTNAAANTTYAVGGDYTISGGKLTRVGGGTIPVGAMVLVSYSQANFTFVEKIDYDVDVAAGIIKRITTGSSKIASLAQVTVAFEYPDPVTLSQVIGQTAVDGTRTGLQAFRNTYALFGFYPRILIAPEFSHNPAIATELEALADQFRAVCLIDAPAGTTRDQAINGRGGSGPCPAFNTSSDRAILCYPRTKVYDIATNAERTEPYSQRLAAVMCKVDNERGYWWSPSNQELNGITGMERLLTASINDPDSEVNMLVSNGIVTIFNAFGTGFKTWGNRSSAWPTVTHPLNFISIRRVCDVVADSIEFAMLQFLDRPINQALIDSIIESVNSFIRTLIAREALIDGRCYWVANKNPVTEIALGHLTFNVDLMPPPPLERLTFEQFVNINMLRSLGNTPSTN